VALAAAIALVAGLVLAATRGSGEQRLAERYAAAYARGDWAALHEDLSAEAQRRYPIKPFARAHRRALETAAARGWGRAGQARRQSHRSCSARRQSVRSKALSTSGSSR